MHCRSNPALEGSAAAQCQGRACLAWPRRLGSPALGSSAACRAGGGGGQGKISVEASCLRSLGTIHLPWRSHRACRRGNRQRWFQWPAAANHGATSATRDKSTSVPSCHVKAAARKQATGLTAAALGSARCTARRPSCRAAGSRRPGTGSILAGPAPPAPPQSSLCVP